MRCENRRICPYKGVEVVRFWVWVAFIPRGMKVYHGFLRTHEFNTYTTSANKRTAEFVYTGLDVST